MSKYFLLFSMLIIFAAAEKNLHTFLFDLSTNFEGF